MTELPDDLASDAPGAGAGSSGGAPATAEVVAHLAATRLFAHVAPEALARLAPAFETVDLAPGAMVARQGAVDGVLSIVIDGTLAIDHRDEDGRVEVVGYAGYAAVIGTRGVFTDEARTTGVMVVEPARVLRVARDALWARLADDLETARALALPETARRRVIGRQAAGVVAGEYEVARFRRHWTALLRHMIFPGILLGASLVLAGIFALALPSPTAVAVLALLALVVPLAAAVWSFFDYANDQLILTNRRLIHIENTPLIDTERVEAPLARVQDIQITVPSVFARVLGYGTIIVQTAGSRGGIVFDALARPELVRDAIFDVVRVAREAAERERDAWIERRVREALGWAPAAGGPPLPGTAGARGPLERTTTGFGRAITYFWPRLRDQNGPVVTWRKHWWLLLRATAIPGALWLALGAWIMARVASALAGSAPEAPPLVPWTWLFGAWLAFLAVLLYLYEDWRNDRYILTDEHIVDIDAKPLGLFANRRQASLAHIQDIRFKIPNPLATLLGYGDLVIETAAEQGGFTFDAVYHPAAVQQEIFARIDAYRAREEAAAQARQASELTRWIAAYHDVARAGPPPGAAQDDASPKRPGDPSTPGAYRAAPPPDDPDAGRSRED